MDEKANAPPSVFTPFFMRSGSGKAYRNQLSIEHPQGLLPAFSARQYSHLPTPQSPGNTLGRYVHDRAHSPESPVPNGMASTSSTSQSRGPGNRDLDLEASSGRPQSTLHQCITPESSPHFSNHIPLDLTGSATPPFFVPSSSHDFATPKQPSAKADPVEFRSNTTPRMSRSSTPPSNHSKPSTALSSPFVAKTSIPSQLGKLPASSSGQGPIAVDDVFSQPSVQPAGPLTTMSTPPISPSSSSNPMQAQAPAAGGEMERIRQAAVEDQKAFLREAEKRRPEYLKRTKRRLSEVENFVVDEEEKPVGITESPQKGRRLKLFQETSEESFEESLMAGGYGRYRTADWVRQPQPIALPSTVVAGSSTIVSLLEEAEEPPPSEKELKKRKRLAAFRESSQQPNSKLSVVELEGKGRVLMEVPSEEMAAPASPEPTPSKKRAQNRRKKKSTEAVPSKKGLGLSDAADDSLEKPNWPDAEFPWRVRTEERLELAKAEKEERLRWIEKFLDRDSEEEDEVELAPAPLELSSDPYHYASEVPRPGRGKMVSLKKYDMSRGGQSKTTQFHSVLSDARDALWAKRSVRTLSYRQRKRQKELDDEEDDEVLCICDGRVNARDLVQCDACQTWYHLQCIGLRNIADLGREEDPWFCRRCVARSRSPSSEPDHALLSEPTFVPSDEPEIREYSDAPFYQPGLHDPQHWPSSKVPKTPTRGYHPYPDPSSWGVESLRGGPSTPKHMGPPVRIYSSPYSGYPEESPFDPTSTPSRGIRFHPPFTTPKSQSLAPRGSVGLFQTPSRPSVRQHYHPDIGTNDNPHQLPAHVLFGRDESPILRSSALPRLPPSSSPRIRPLGQSHSFLDDSPVVRSVGPELQK
ncbi:hypothetical protein CVT26_010765 [Gymnopilus dilepis]|uniref:PHD-type domain-containing protein n=1 Tax=Gymnopilus dilepis TaxID=231916 RepID=A0A409W568_9AGAR|nr:hypothetical protein CVT26_010765 [Gymnopilus dilepis]